MGQTYQNYELIVVDDGSTDHTRHIVHMFKDSRIEYIYTVNSGIPAKPRNIGIKRSKGQYIAFCDDDDIWYPEKIDCQLRELSNSSYGLCFTNIDYINGYGKKLKRKHKIKKRYLNTTFNKFILGGGNICNSSVMIKRDLIETIGLFNEDPKLRAVEDYHYWARIMSKYKACCVDKILVSYRINSPDSVQAITNTDWLKKQIYLMKSIKLAVPINKVLYYGKLIKLTLIYMIKAFLKMFKKY